MPPLRSLTFAAAAVLILIASIPCRAQIVAVTTARHDLKLGMTVPGRVAEIAVKVGDRVKAGDILIRLDDQASKALVDLYALRAGSTVSIEAAEAEMKLADVEERRVREAFEKDAAGHFEVERAALQTNLARLRLVQAREAHQQAAAQLAQATIDHAHFTLRAPLAGVIEDIAVSPGETVEQLKPVLRLVVTDPLQIDAHVPTSLTAALTTSSRAFIVPRDADTPASRAPGSPTSPAPPAAPREARIVHIAQVADARSNTRMVRLELPNPGNQPAGNHVLVYFNEPPPGAPGTPGATGAPRD